MPNAVTDDLRSRARLLLIAAITADVGAVAALLLPVASGGTVTDLLPLALMLFVASSALLMGAIWMRQKADKAEREA